MGLPHSSNRARKLKVKIGGRRRTRADRIGEIMSVAKVEQRALSLLTTFEKAGKTVIRVTIEGRKIEIVLSQEQVVDEYERIDMRHGET